MATAPFDANGGCPEIELEEQHPGPEDVGLRVRRLPLGLLGRQIRRGADDDARLGRRKAPEVEEHDPDLAAAGASEKYVLGLHVSVNRSVPVRLGERTEHGNENREGRGRIDSTGPSERRAQRRPLEELHGDVGPVLARSDVERPGDVRVPEGEDLRRWGEASPAPEHLEGHDASRALVPRPVDLARAALAEALLDEVSGDAIAPCGCEPIVRRPRERLRRTNRTAQPPGRRQAVRSGPQPR